MFLTARDPNKTLNQSFSQNVASVQIICLAQTNTYTQKSNKDELIKFYE